MFAAGQVPSVYQRLLFLGGLPLPATAVVQPMLKVWRQVSIDSVLQQVVPIF